MKTLADRLKQARLALGLTQDEAATAVGAKKRGYQENENGNATPRSDVIAGFVGLGVNANWLLAGDGPMMIGDPSGEQQARQQDMLRAVLDDDPGAEARREARLKQAIGKITQLRSALAALPDAQSQRWQACLHNALNSGAVSAADLDALLGLLELTSAADGGVIWVPVHPEQQAEGLYPVPFSQIQLASLNLDPKQLVVCISTGDAMEPTIKASDRLLTNLASTNTQDGKLFMVRLGSQLYVKRIQCLANGGRVLISDNKEYQPQTIPADQLDQLDVVGQVVWIGKEV